MTRSISLISYDHPASPDDLEKFKKVVRFSRGKLTHKRIKGGYSCYCSRCGQHFDLTDEQMAQTREAGLCFHCAHPVHIVQKRVTKNPQYGWAWLALCNEKGAMNGYHVLWKDEEDNIEIVNTTHVLHYVDGKGYLYGIVKNMGYSISRTESRDYWRKERASYNAYINYFHIVEDNLTQMTQGKKEFYESLNLKLKSNQATFVKKGIYNEKQLSYIQRFDLNYPEELHKYKDYIRMHRVIEEDTLPKLSVNTLDYLVRNNFSAGEYFDYMRACRTLGIKWERPKDLCSKHNELLKLIDIRKNEVYAQNVKNRHEQLVKNEWKKGTMAIHVFHDIKEMQKVADQLKNCIAKLYVKPYSDKTTDVYYGTTDDNITFALEIANGKLKQLRGACNLPVNNDVTKFVGEWCRRLGYEM